MFNPSEIANIAKAEESLWWYRGMRDISFALLDPLARQGRFRRVLDAGCGTGFFAAELRSRYGAEVFAMDLETAAIEYCRQRASSHPVQASVLSPPFPDRTFDLVCSFDVLSHLPMGEEKTAFRELARVLAPEGILLLRVPALDVFRSSHSQYIWERQRFTRSRLAELSQENGLRILKLSYANFLLTPVSFLKFRVVEPLLRRPPESGVHPVSPVLDRLLYAPLALESRWLAGSRGFPWGQSVYLVAQCS